MSESIPLIIDPWLMFRRNAEIAGTLPLNQMPNLQSSQNREVGNAGVQFSVIRREDGQIVVTGVAQVELEFMCQRCLSGFAQEVKADFELALVKYEHQLSSVSGDDDTIVCEDSLELASLIEQELILSLPMISKHADCQVALKDNVTVDANSHQPFANLKDLLS